MSSFLQKLKGKGVVQEGGAESHDDMQQEVTAPEATHADTPSGVTQLPVDVYQSDREIVIYSQIPGTDVSQLDVSIEGDNDVITIQGVQRRPEELAEGGAAPDEEADGTVQIHVGEHTEVIDNTGEFSFEECAWGQFFRQIILPQEVDASHAQAKVRDGVLVLRMPLKAPKERKIRMNVVKLDTNH
jgi:HSP20 family molecular chaperone IbpA